MQGNQRKDVLRQRVFWVKQRTRFHNRIHRIISRHPRIEMPQVTGWFGKKGMEVLEKARLPDPDQLLLKQNLQMLQSVGEQICDAEKRIENDGFDWFLGCIGSVDLLFFNA